MSLTPKQKAILDFIAEYQSLNGYSPTQQEIAQHFGYKSLGTVQNYLVRIERSGALKKTWNAKRDLQLTEDSSASTTHDFPAAVSLPVMGRVAAGFPIESYGTSQALDVPRSLLGHGDHYVLQVKGDSMIDDGILEGDFIIVHRNQAHPTPGQMVVALIDNEATVKRFFKRKKGTRELIELHPANPKYAPIEVNPEAQTFSVEGVVVGVVRKL